MKKPETDIWQSRPVPESPEPHPESRSEQLTKGGVRVTAATVRGKKHKHEGTNCDDWYAVRVTDRFTAAAVCDGAGSKPFSRIGAKAAAEAALGIDFGEILTEERLTALETATDSPEFIGAVGIIAEAVRNTAVKAFEAVNAAAAERAEREPEVFSADINDYSATFLFVLCIPLKNETLTAAISVGDGNIAAFESNCIRILGVPAHGDYSGETEFLQSEGVLSEQSLRARTRIIRSRTDTVILATDGVADDFFPNETEFVKLRDMVKSRVDAGGDKALLEWLDTYYVRGSFDDRTLIMLQNTEQI
jgi:hypothetical protein